MGASIKQCPHCATPLRQEHRFCPECGKPLVTDNPPTSGKGVGRKPAFKGTMLAYQAPVAVAEKPAGAEPGAPNTAADSVVSAKDSENLGATSTPISPPRRVVSSSNGAKKPFTASKTLLGQAGQFHLGAPPVEPSAPATPVSQPQEVAKPETPVLTNEVEKPRVEAIARPRAKTLFGMPGLTGADVESKLAAGSAPSTESATELGAENRAAVFSGGSGSSPQSSPSAKGGKPQSASRTILGMPGSVPGDEAVFAKRDHVAEAGADATPVQAVSSTRPAPETGRTILGVPSGYEEQVRTRQNATTHEEPFDEPTAAARHEDDGEEFEPEEAEPAEKSSRPLIMGGLAAAIVLLLAAAGAYMFLREPSSNVRASVVAMEGGEGLLFEVPGVASGSKIRFGGQEKPLAAGRATFLLAADSVRAGENVVMFDVIEPDGKPRSDTITLTVDFRVRVDTSPLQTAEPAIDVLVNALPGTTVTLDGKALELDKEGRGVRRYPIDASGSTGSGVIDHVVRYRVQPASGEATVDEIRTKIPIASMQIDRPGLEAVTDKNSIEIAGAVAPSAQVSIDGKPVSVQAGRFLYRLPLNEVGTFAPKIISRETGKAPRAITLAIKRVADLKKEAEHFKADSSLTYARISQNPTIYSGQKIALEGRVFNVNVQNGQSVLQVLVRECPSGTRCSIWVTYPFATEAVVDSWVRILGAVQGQQQFRSENNRVVTVPKIAATYVLPISE
jgi:hypothetical protein